MPMFSIIIPMYNSEKFIDRAIQSLLNQTYKNFEIILVNDCSTDQTLLVCEKYMKSNIKLLDLDKNLGVSNARNIGLQNAKGEYVLFLDSDDWLDRNTLYLLNENIKNSDMLVYGVVYNRNDKQVAQPLPTIGKFSVTDLFSMESTLFDVSILHWVTNKVFNLSIIRKNNLLFDQTLKMGEDLDFCMKYLEKIKFITVLDKYLYYYDRTNNKSLTNSNIKSLPERTKINNDNIKSFLERNNIDIDAFNSYKKEQFKYVESKINNSTFTKQEKDELISKNIILNMN